jgi:uncharacterized protein with PIN domain
MFDETGCEECRNAWVSANRNKALQQIGKENYDRQARLHRCKNCGTFWEEPNGAYPSGLSEDEAKRLYNV